MLEPRGLAVGPESEQSDTQKLINFPTKFKAAHAFSFGFRLGANPCSDPASSGAQVQSAGC